MIDLSKLTPAPWTSTADNGTNAANAAFVALARNAFDVMMRRGWGVTPAYEKPPYDEFCVQDSADQQIRGLIAKTWPDPFTALVEADKWYKENVESKS